MVVKGYTIKDNNTKVMVFTSPTLVKNKNTGKVFETKGEVTVDDFEDLLKLTPKTRVKEVKHKETEETISEVEYLEREKELLSKRIYDEQEYIYNWISLDDEFNYRKFIASYEKVYETYYAEEQILVEDIKTVQLDTNHPFIKSKFQNSGEISDVCVYNKPAAYHSILKEKMDEIGAKYIPDQSTFSTASQGKLEWTNSTHSCIRYVKFAGDYLFSDGYDIKHSPVGTFEKLELEYNNDRQKIRKTIQDKYLLKFGKFDEDKSPKVLEAMSKISTALNHLNSLSPMKKSENSKGWAQKELREAKHLLNQTFNIDENV